MKVSVVIPVYNVEHYLDWCITTLLAQTYSDWEAVLVDDGSTDSSPELCDAWAARDQRIQVIHQENRGLGMTRNRGLDAVVGEYVLFLDSDDYFGPELIKNLVGCADRCKTDLVIGGFTIVRPDGKKIPSALPGQRVFRSPDEMRELLYGTVGAPPEAPLDSQYGLSACGRLYRRAVIEKANLRFVSERQLISEDLIFNMDFLQQAASAAVIPDVSYFYRTNTGSLSKRHRGDRFERDLVLVRAVQERLKEYPETDYRLYLQRLLISRARFDIMQEADYRDVVDLSYPLQKKTEEILCTPELQEAMRHYPWWKLPKMQGIFTWCMKRRLIWAMLALIRLKRRFLSGGAREDCSV